MFNMKQWASCILVFYCCLFCISLFLQICLYQSIIIVIGNFSFIIWQLERSCFTVNTITSSIDELNPKMLVWLSVSVMLSLLSNLDMKGACVGVGNLGSLCPKLNQWPSLHVLYYELHVFFQGFDLIYWLPNHLAEFTLGWIIKSNLDETCFDLELMIPLCGK